MKEPAGKAGSFISLDIIEFAQVIFVRLRGVGARFCFFVFGQQLFEHANGLLPAIGYFAIWSEYIL